MTSSKKRSPQSERDLSLLRRFEPQLRLNPGELFRPMDIDTFLMHTDLVVTRKRERPRVVESRPNVTQETLVACGQAPVEGKIHLRLVDRTLTALQLISFHARSELREFKKGTGRHARVGLAARLLDVAFRVSLVTRGRVPGGTAAAAAVAYRSTLDTFPDPVYYGRVIRNQYYIVLQYWFFYAYNDYRSHYHGGNDHEADWELVSVFLDEGTPGEPTVAWLAYATHDLQGADLRRRWDDPEVERIGEHPVVNVGAGSHASYFSAGEYVIRIELPLLAKAAAVIAAVRSVWQTVLRQGGVQSRRTGGELNVAFVDYARGDGLKIGPDAELAWDAQLLEEQPALLHYRGLWGRYIDDPIRGEDAPAGPRFNRDGTVRTVWFDPAGWAELTTVPPASREIPAAEEELERLERELAELQRTIAEAETEAVRLGLRVETLSGASEPGKQLQEYEDRLFETRDSVSHLRKQASETELLSRAMHIRLERLRAGDRGDPRAHLHRPAVPLGPGRLRLHRIAETWSAISAGILLLAMSASVIIYHAALLPLLLLSGAFLFAESLFHRRV
ncbi:MAG TPA: hypothetical protein VFE20_03990, partial [Thermoleophilia bacterium]|nr:hypothetical protein [Thermoleophilia bacterium]